MARFVFFLLVLANVALAAWVYLHREGPKTPPPTEVNGGALKIVAVADPATAQADALAGRKLAASLSGAACVDFGVKPADGSRAQVLFASMLLGDRISSRNAEEFSRYTVGLPAQKDRKSAETLMANLKKAGVIAGLALLAALPPRLLTRWTAAAPERLGQFVLHFPAALRGLAAPRTGLPLLAWSTVYWTLTVLQLWLVLHACGLPLGPAEAAAIVGIVGLSIQLPGGPAQVGSYQVGSVLALGLFVPAADLAGPGSSFVAISFLLGLVGAAILALPGAWLLARANRRSSDLPQGPQPAVSSES